MITGVDRVDLQHEIERAEKLFEIVLPILEHLYALAILDTQSDAAERYARLMVQIRRWLEDQL